MNNLNNKSPHYIGPGTDKELVSVYHMDNVNLDFTEFSTFHPETEILSI